MPKSKKEQIREAAISVICKEGFHKATTDQIAKKAGVGVGTIYNYFNNKDDILSYIFEVELNIRKQFWKKLNRELSAIDRLNEFINFHFRNIKTNIDVYHILVREYNFPSKHATNPVDNFEDTMITLLSNLIEEGIKNDEIDDNIEDLEIIAASIFGLIKGTSQRLVKRLEQGCCPDSVDEEQILRHIRKIIWEGLRK